MEMLIQFLIGKNSGSEVCNYTKNGKKASYPRNKKEYFKQAISWSDVTSGPNSFRLIPVGFASDICSPFLPIKNYQILLGIINSKILSPFYKLLNPTLHFTTGDFNNLPLLTEDSLEVNKIVDECIDFSKKEWSSRETSEDFKQNELIRIKGQDLEETYDLYQQYWKNKFFQLHKNEEELNRQFIDIYGLQDELTPDVPLKDITILKEETDIINGELVFDAKEVLTQFMSYAVGCMFGRYSLEKEGLILANQGETLEDYLTK